MGQSRERGGPRFGTTDCAPAHVSRELLANTPRASIARADSASDQPPFSARHLSRHASGSARFASRDHGSSSADASSPHTAVPSKNHQSSCRFSASRAAARGVHCPFLRPFPRLRDPRPIRPATTA